MKKLVSVIMALCLLVTCSVGLAEIDLSGMTYDELVNLKDRINLAMWNSETWQEVEVPQGVWVVGEDIPAGKWTIKCPDGYRKCEINWGPKLDKNGERIAWDGVHSVYNSVYNPNYKYYEVGDGETEYSFTAKEGDYIVVDDGHAIFTPYSGKPSLGFK